MTMKEFIYYTGCKFHITLETLGWCARFEDLYESFRSGYGGSAGFGATPNEALTNYFRQISGKTLVYDPKGPNQKFISVPKITDCE